MQFTKLAELPDTLPVVSVIHHRRTNCVSDEGRRPASTRAAVGVRGHFMEGARKVADVEIDAIAGLHEDPST